MKNLDLFNSSVNEMKILQQNYFDGIVSSTKKDAIDNTEYKDISGLYVQWQKRDLTTVFSKLDNNILESVINIKGIIDIEEVPADKGIYKVRYNCGASGLAVSGAYYGFYYSSDNEQNIMSGKTDWVPKDNGWFEKSSSDKSYEYGTYIEKITDNWFYYEEYF